MIPVGDGAFYLPGYSNRQKMPTNSKLSDFFCTKSSSEGAEIPIMIDLLAIGPKGCLEIDQESGRSDLYLGSNWPQLSAYAELVREVFPAYKFTGMEVLWVDHGRIDVVEMASARAHSHQGDAL